MKKHTILIFAIVLFLFTSCQSGDSDVTLSSIVGVWQINNPEIGSGYNENYQFFDNGNYKFNTSQYDELRSVISINGKYWSDSESLYLVPEFLIKTSGGNKIERSRSTSLNHSWSILGDTAVIKEALIDQDTFVLDLNICKFSSTIPCMLIEGDLLYRIIENPNDY